MPNLFSHLRLITMYLTIRTKRLFFHEWTLLTSLFCIIRKKKDRKDTSALPVFFLSDVFFGNTAGSSLPRHTVLSAVSFLLCPSYSTLSAISASGFSVLTLKKKYNRWHTHTTAIQILPIGTFFTQIKPIAMTTVTIPVV